MKKRGHSVTIITTDGNPFRDKESNIKYSKTVETLSKSKKNNLVINDIPIITSTSPTGFDASVGYSYQMTVEDADADPSAVDYINVHGTSTPLGDISETKAIKNLFGKHAYKLNISSKP